MPVYGRGPVGGGVVSGSAGVDCSVLSDGGSVGVGGSVGAGVVEPDVNKKYRE